jgi:hypothetical protein
MTLEQFLDKWKHFIEVHCPQGRSILKDLQLLMERERREGEPLIHPIELAVHDALDFGDLIGD